MLLIKEKIDRSQGDFADIEAQQILSLPFEMRQKARFVAKLESGQDVGLQIERGQILRDGDKLSAVDGTIVQIKAANESVSTVKIDDQKLLSRVCYHLGNRHVPLQVESGWCRYLEDHVLDEMVDLLGAKATHENAPFEPEAGAYSGGHHHAHIQPSDAPKTLTDIDSFSSI